MIGIEARQLDTIYVCYNHCILSILSSCNRKPNIMCQAWIMKMGFLAAAAASDTASPGGRRQDRGSRICKQSLISFLLIWFNFIYKGSIVIWAWFTSTWFSPLYSIYKMLTYSRELLILDSVYSLLIIK